MLRDDGRVGTDRPGHVNDRAADGTPLPGPAGRDRSVVLMLTC
ncbi:hypothetical protein [Streptomyces brasiliscabiei]|nr:hypothetical protein [Streptomyces brasiliscabiei]